MPRRPASDQVLTAAQEKFCVEYVRRGLEKSHGAGSAAYVAAYPHAAKWQPSALYPAASRLLARDNVRARIDELRREAASRTVVTAQRVLDEIARVGFSNPKDVLAEDGTLLPPAQWPDHVAAAISAMEFDEGRLVKVKFWPKTAALDMLAKNLGIYERDNEQRNPTSVGHLSAAARQLIESRLRDILRSERIALPSPPRVDSE